MAKFYTPINPELDHTNAKYYRIIYWYNNTFYSGIWWPTIDDDTTSKHLRRMWEDSNAYWDIEFSLTGTEPDISLY